MTKILGWQLAALAAVSALSGLIEGWIAFWSAVAGGICYLVPSAVTVLILKFLKPYPELAGKGFIVGEFLKIALSVVMMLFVFALWHENLNFIPFLLGLLIVSHVVFLAFLRVQRYGK